MNTYQNVLKEFEAQINKKEMETVAARLIMQHVLQKEGSDFFLFLNQAADPQKVKEMQELLNRYLNYTPLQYLFGYTYFYGLKFKVNEEVLIPRFDTENLVSVVLEEFKEATALIDVGTGSGNIAVVLALKMPDCKVYACDISEGALKVARENATANKATVYFKAGNLLEPFIEEGIQVPLIVANPPYIAIDDKEVGELVRNKEPSLALFARKNGLAIYEELFKQASKVLTPEGAVVVEIGYRQAEAIKELAYHYLGIKLEIKVHQDLNGLDRVVSIKRHK